MQREGENPARNEVGSSSDDEEEEFAFWVRGPEDDGPTITADDIFSNGQIRPIYPVFDRELLLPRNHDDKTSTAAEGSEDDLIRLRRLAIEERSASPSPDRCKKSSSTGSSIRLRLRDLVVGRSHSDGKDKFVFLAAAEKPVKAAAVEGEGKKKGGKGKVGKVTEIDMVTAHRLYYGGGGGQAAVNKGVGRRSFLPYRQDLVGFFANVNGITRTRHPY